VAPLILTLHFRPGWDTTVKNSPFHAGQRVQVPIVEEPDGGEAPVCEPRTIQPVGCRYTD